MNDKFRFNLKENPQFPVYGAALCVCVFVDCDPLFQLFFFFFFFFFPPSPPAPPSATGATSSWTVGSAEITSEALSVRGLTPPSEETEAKPEGLSRLGTVKDEDVEGVYTESLPLPEGEAGATVGN